VEALQGEADYLEGGIADIRKRIAELEAEASKG